MFEEVKQILGDSLQIQDRVGQLTTETPLLGDLPELDSMGVVSVITALEDNYGFFVEDDEISAETFETLGSLVEFVEHKVANG